MPEAVWFVAPGRVELRDEPRGDLGPGCVRVSSLVSAISAGSEMLVHAGLAPRDLDPDLSTVAGTFALPMKFGYATVGRVTELGSGIDLSTGDLVFALHPHQTEFAVPAELVTRLPSGVDPEVGAFAANLETAVTLALDAHPRLGETVLVTGQGVVGLLLVMLLRRAGAGAIVTIDLHERRRTASIAAGADHALSASPDATAEIFRLTEGRGADVAIDVSGSAAGLQACIDAAAFGGTVVVGSWFGQREVPLDLGAAFHRRRLRVVASQVSTLDPSLGGRWDRARRTALVAQLLRELPLGGLVSHRFPFREAPAAYELLARSPGDALQVLLTHV